MQEFKFFQKGTVDMIDGEVRATASFNDDTPEGHMSRRRLYHTDINLYGRLRQSNNEMEQYFIERDLREQRDLNDNPIRLFNTTTTVTVNPTFWSKIKIFGMRIKLVLIESWRMEPVGVVVAGVLTTIVTIISIAKLIGL